MWSMETAPPIRFFIDTNEDGTLSHSKSSGEENPLEHCMKKSILLYYIILIRLLI